MKRVGLLLPVGALTALLLSSCSPDLAETSYGEKENDWQSYIRKSYPAWRAPRTLPPIKREKSTGPFDEFSANEDAVQSESVSVAEPVVEEGTVKETVTTIIPEKDGGDLIVSEDVTITEVPPVPTEANTAVATKAYKVQKNDSLSKIAKKVYGDGNKWRVILDANKDVLPNPNKLRPGMELRIPQLP